MVNLHTHPEQVLIVELYSLHMVCFAYQNGTTMSWTCYSQYCAEAHVTRHPENIPLNTTVPNRAPLDCTVRARYRWWSVKSPIV